MALWSKKTQFSLLILQEALIISNKAPLVKMLVSSYSEWVQQWTQHERSSTSSWHLLPHQQHFPQMHLLWQKSRPRLSQRSQRNPNILGVYADVYLTMYMLATFLSRKVRRSKAWMHQLSRSQRLLPGSHVSLLLLARKIMVTVLMLTRTSVLFFRSIQIKQNYHKVKIISYYSTLF